MAIQIGWLGTAASFHMMGKKNLTHWHLTAQLLSILPV